MEMSGKKTLSLAGLVVLAGISPSLFSIAWPGSISVGPQFNGVNVDVSLTRHDPAHEAATIQFYDELYERQLAQQRRLEAR